MKHPCARRSRASSFLRRRLRSSHPLRDGPHRLRRKGTVLSGRNVGSIHSVMLEFWVRKPQRDDVLGTDRIAMSCGCKERLDRRQRRMREICIDNTTKFFPYPVAFSISRVVLPSSRRRRRGANVDTMNPSFARGYVSRYTRDIKIRGEAIHRTMAWKRRPRDIQNASVLMPREHDAPPLRVRVQRFS